jgi:hypothetical protein
MAVLQGALTWILIALCCLLGVKMFFASISLQFNFLRGRTIWKAAWRFRKGIIVFALALTVVGLVTEYVSPALADAAVATGRGVSASAETIGGGISTGAGAVWQAVPILIGIVLALAYWALVSVRWIAKARSKDGRLARQMGAGVVFLLLMVVYMAVFIA